MRHYFPFRHQPILRATLNDNLSGDSISNGCVDISFDAGRLDGND
jgi:hypothetical protein